MDRVDLLARQTIKKQIAGCTKCLLHEGCTQPVSYYGPPNAKIAVVGEAPGKHEDIRNRPFVGPAGQMARTWLKDSGIDPESVAWLNVVCCYPGRTPLQTEVEACRSNLKGQLDAIRPEWILVLGGVATQAFHPSIKIGEVRGLWWRPSNHAGVLERETWALATWHPAAVLRKPTLGKEAIEDVQFFRLCSAEEVPPVVSELCVKCHGPADVWWQDIPWCNKHWGQYKKKRGQGRKVLKDGDRRVAGNTEWVEPQLFL